MKKLINKPENVTHESTEGCMFTRKDLFRLDDYNVVVKKEALPDDRVRVVVGGGGGHEPVFMGFVGKGMADASANGDVFTSPSADTVEAAIKAVGSGAGTVLIYGNYQGDILNFDMAQDMCRMEGMTVETVRTTDDVSSAPPGNKEDRRGTAADLLVIKIAGAAAQRGYSFDEVLHAARQANDNCRSLGIALSSCTVPAVGKPIFHIDDDVMMVGMGLHGEAGIRKERMSTADVAAEIMWKGIMDDDLGLAKGDRITLLMNGYGSTTMMELFIVNKRLNQLAEKAGLVVHANLVGNYCTSMEMAGCSTTIMKLDDELANLMDDEADSSGYTQVKKG